MCSRSVPALVFAALLTFPLFAQQSQPASAQAVFQRDPQAVAAFQQSIAAMGGNVPTDSTATGTVTITAGGATDQGTIRFRTRGTGQTLEEVQTSSGTRTNIFSNDEASETFAGMATPLASWVLARRTWVAVLSARLHSGRRCRPQRILALV